MEHLDVGHFARHRQKVVGEGPIEELSIVGIDTALVKRTADGLDQAAPYLLIDQLRVYDAAAIIDYPAFEQADEPCADIDLDESRLDSVAAQIRHVLRKEKAPGPPAGAPC